MIGVGIREIPHDLVERVESGTGRDRVLDRDIWIALGWAYEKRGKDRKLWLYAPDHDGQRGYRRDPTDGLDWAIWNMALTSSLDAVVSLIEQRLPEITDNSAADFLAASIDEMLVRGWRPSEPNIPQICRAVLAAFLRALQEAGTLADAHSKNPPEAEHG